MTIQVPPGEGRLAGPSGDAPDRGGVKVSGRAAARPVWERVIRFLAAVSALCAAAAFPASAVFNLESVDIRGNRVVSDSDVLRRVGIAPGASAFQVNAFQIRDRLRADPLVADAWISLAFPHRLTVYVRERTPVAALRLEDGYVLLDRGAVAISREPDPGPYPSLRVDRLDAAWVQPGTVVPSADVRLGVSLAGGLQPPLRGEVAGLRVDAGGEAVLETKDGVAVLLGGPEGLQQRLTQVLPILAAVRDRGFRVQYVDLRFPGSVIVKPVGTGGDESTSLSPRSGKQEKP
jgi:cell division protein FtsQ